MVAEAVCSLYGGPISSCMRFRYIRRTGVSPGPRTMGISLQMMGWVAGIVCEVRSYSYIVRLFSATQTMTMQRSEEALAGSSVVVNNECLGRQLMYLVACRLS